MSSDSVRATPSFSVMLAETSLGATFDLASTVSFLSLALLSRLRGAFWVLASSPFSLELRGPALLFVGYTCFLSNFFELPVLETKLDSF